MNLKGKYVEPCITDQILNEYEFEFVADIYHSVKIVCACLGFIMTGNDLGLHLRIVVDDAVSVILK